MIMVHGIHVKLRHAYYIILVYSFFCIVVTNSLTTPHRIQVVIPMNLCENLPLVPDKDQEVLQAVTMTMQPTNYQSQRDKKKNLNYPLAI